MTTKSTAPSTASAMCEHMAAIINKRGYERDHEQGLLKVKTCLGPSKHVLMEHCGHTSPASAASCYSCGGTTFNQEPTRIIEIATCHFRCKKCKKVTRGCDVRACMDCGANNLTLLPPAINPDIYGFRVVNPG